MNEFVSKGSPDTIDLSYCWFTDIDIQNENVSGVINKLDHDPLPFTMSVHEYNLLIMKDVIKDHLPREIFNQLIKYIDDYSQHKYEEGVDEGESSQRLLLEKY